MNASSENDINSQDESLDVENTATSDIVSDFLSEASLPDPVSRNLIKSVSRLCSAAIDFPVAYLEEKTTERRAVTEARVKLIHSTANQISEQIKVDREYARRAVAQFGNRILREQANIDAVVAKSIEQLKQKDDFQEKATLKTEIDDDWLENFGAEARRRSTAEIRDFFARILAEEITNPKSFSVKTLRLLGNLDKNSAALFQKFCSICVTLGDFGEDPIDSRVVSLSGNAGSNSLSEYGLGFDQLNLLNEYGLIISDYNSWMDYQVCIQETPNGGSTRGRFSVPFSHQNRYWTLQATAGSKSSTKLQLHGVALTRSGRELMKIVNCQMDEQYLHDLIKFFKSKQLTMKEVENPKDYFLFLEKVMTKKH